MVNLEVLREYLESNPDNIPTEILLNLKLTLYELHDLRTSIDKGFPAETLGEVGVAYGPLNINDEDFPENFSVTLVSFGQNKIQVLKAIREYTNLTIKECSRLTNNLPAIILTGLSEEEAFELQSRLTAAGAIVKREII